MAGIAGGKKRFGCHAKSSKKSQTYLDGRFQFEEDGLGDEDLARLGAEESDLRLEELHLLAGATTPDLEQAIDYRIEVDLMLVGHGGSRRVPERWPTGMEEGSGRFREGTGCGGRGKEETWGSRVLISRTSKMMHFAILEMPRGGSSVLVLVAGRRA